MKKFKFRFQTVLDLRSRELEKAELKVAEGQMHVLNAKNKLQELKDTLRNSKQNLQIILQAGNQIDILQVNSYHYYNASLDRKIDQQRKKIKELEKILEKLREEMLIIRQKKLMLEKLQEQELKAYLKEYEMADLKIIDEIATSRYSRG